MSTLNRVPSVEPTRNNHTIVFVALALLFGVLVGLALAPILPTSTKTVAYVPYYKNNNQFTDERYVAQPIVPAAEMSPGLASLQTRNIASDDRYLARPQITAVTTTAYNLESLAQERYRAQRAVAEVGAAPDLYANPELKTLEYWEWSAP